jgi:hypothetical protein
VHLRFKQIVELPACIVVILEEQRVETLFGSSVRVNLPVRRKVDGTFVVDSWVGWLELEYPLSFWSLDFHENDVFVQIKRAVLLHIEVKTVFQRQAREL